MTPLFKKLNFKNGSDLLCLNAPPSFTAELEALEAVTNVVTDEKELEEIEFAIAFVTTQAEIGRTIGAIHPKLEGDAVVWFCYPKGSSKKYKCDFNRDTGWQPIGDLGMEGVRQVAIDEDWSALRFRKAEHIKTITRRESFALSANAKQRTAEKGL